MNLGARAARPQWRGEKWEGNFNAEAQGRRGHREEKKWGEVKENVKSHVRAGGMSGDEGEG